MPILTSIAASIGISAGATAAAGAAAATAGTVAATGATVAAGASTLSTVTSLIGAAGAIAGGISAFQASNYQASVAELNAKIADDNAARAIEASQQEQLDQDSLTSAMIGEQLAAVGASGLSVGSTTARKVRKVARRLGRKDSLNVRQRGNTEANNFKQAAAGERSSAGMFKSQGQSALLSSFFKAGGSLLSKARPSNQFGLRTLKV